MSARRFPTLGDWIIGIIQGSAAGLQAGLQVKCGRGEGVFLRHGVPKTRVDNALTECASAASLPPREGLSKPLHNPVAADG
eukprot:2797806-Pyramimonas_sp.AAC.1